MIHVGSGKTSKQFAALSSSAAANFGSRRRCCFLHPPQQADRGAGIPPLFQPQTVGPLEQGVLGWFWQHPPTCPHGTFCSSSNTSLLLPGKAGGLQHSPVSVHLFITWPSFGFNSDPFGIPVGISKGDFHRKREQHILEHVLLPCTPEIQEGLPLIPTAGAAALVQFIAVKNVALAASVTHQVSLQHSGRRKHFAQILCSTSYLVAVHHSA